jgi:hypothetical protein
VCYPTGEFTDAGGIALRYGGFYGSPDDVQVELVRRRRFPIVGNGDGMFSFVDLEDAGSRRYSDLTTPTISPSRSTQTQ